MYGLLNLGSLILGLVAWIIPVAILLKKNFSLMCVMKGAFLSFVCTLVSLFMQILYTKHLVDINDWSALMDTQGTVVLAAIILLIIVIILNGFLLYRSFSSNLERKSIL